MADIDGGFGDGGAVFEVIWDLWSRMLARSGENGSILTGDPRYPRWYGVFREGGKSRHRRLGVDVCSVGSHQSRRRAAEVHVGRPWCFFGGWKWCCRSCDEEWVGMRLWRRGCGVRSGDGTMTLAMSCLRQITGREGGRVTVSCNDNRCLFFEPCHSIYDPNSINSVCSIWMD